MRLSLPSPSLFSKGAGVGCVSGLLPHPIILSKPIFRRKLSRWSARKNKGEEFVRFLTEEFEKDPEGIWKTEFFGKTLHDLVKEGIQAKLSRMPPHAQEKLQETLTKILNEGSGGLICIII